MQSTHMSQIGSSPLGYGQSYMIGVEVEAEVHLGVSSQSTERVHLSLLIHAIRILVTVRFGVFLRDIEHLDGTFVHEAYGSGCKA